MTSINISLSDKRAILSTNLHPEIELDPESNYTCCLLELDIELSSEIKNTITNHNSTFTYIIDKNRHHTNVTHESFDIEYLATQLAIRAANRGAEINCIFNKHTMKYSIRIGPNVEIDFTYAGSIGILFGFERRMLRANTLHEADYSVSIFDEFHDVKSILVNCDLVRESYHNGVSTHTMYEFYPEPAVNYRIIELPDQFIYYPIINRNIRSLHLTITDQYTVALVLKEIDKIKKSSS